MMRRTVLATLLLAGSMTPIVRAQPGGWFQAMQTGTQARQNGDFTTAERAYAEAVRLAEATAGSEFEWALALAKRAGIHHDLHRSKNAERGYLDALKVLNKLPATPRVVHALNLLKISLGALYIELEQPSKAKRLRVEELTFEGTDAHEVANANSILASIALAEGRLADAEQGWLRALATFEATHRSEDAAIILSNLGVVAVHQGDMAGAAGRLTRATDLFRSSVGLEDVLTLNVQANLGQVLYRLGRHEEAVGWLERAHRLGIRWIGEEHPVTERLGLAYAMGLQKVGRGREAKALRRRTAVMAANPRAILPEHSTVDLIHLARPRK